MVYVDDFQPSNIYIFSVIISAKKPPQLVCVIVFSNDVCRRTLLESLQSADSESVNYKCNTEANPSNQGNVHLK